MTSTRPVNLANLRQGIVDRSRAFDAEQDRHLVEHKREPAVMRPRALQSVAFVFGKFSRPWHFCSVGRAWGGALRAA